ncbi:MAG: DOMON domain-containing protein [Candidatus Tenebribacter davisii]|nr:DOMON domain-containing protein [Candidatus Tenebribacter davisii]
MKKYMIFMLIGLMAALYATDMVVNYANGDMVSIPVDQVEQITFEQYEMVTVEGIELQWRTDDEFLYVNVSAPTTGWVAVGFDPTNQMADANIIIGYVNDGGEVIIRDDFGTSGTSHASDESLGGMDDIADHYGMEENGTTMLHFRIPLNSGDMYDKVLVPGNNYNIILAYGSADNFTGFHTMATGTNIDL